jgi:phosphoribosylpyrophosphate synthetase
MDLHASQIQGFFDVPVDKYVDFGISVIDLLIMSWAQRKFYFC